MKELVINQLAFPQLEPAASSHLISFRYTVRRGRPPRTNEIDVKNRARWGMWKKEDLRS